MAKKTESVILSLVPDNPISRVTLRLKADSEGNIDVRGLDEKGDDWYLLSFQKNGTLVRCSSLPVHLGFSLDSESRIKESDK